MRVRATLTLRNDALLSARERLRLTQMEAAKAIEVPVYVLSNFERLRYDQDHYIKWIKEYPGDRPEIIAKAEKIAKFYELELNEVLPRLGGVEIKTVTQVADVDPEQLRLLVGAGSHTIAIAMNPLEKAEQSEVLELLEGAIDRLGEQPAKVIRDRMAGRTLLEIGGELGLSKERVRCIESKAIRNLQRGALYNKLLEACTGKVRVL